MGFGAALFNFYVMILMKKSCVSVGFYKNRHLDLEILQICSKLIVKTCSGPPYYLESSFVKYLFVPDFAF